MIIDLHCHSRCSDGELTPTELVNRAHEMGVNVLALTDHDTTQGIPEAQAQADITGIKLISGIEFSSVWKGIGIHVVGLGFDMKHPVMVQAVAIQEKRRITRAALIAERLEKIGAQGILDKAMTIADGAQIGRPHFAMALVEMGKVKNIAAAFKKYLGAGKIGDVKAQWPEISEVIEWIRSSGGTAVLAHPDKYKMTRTKFKCFLEAFVAAGGNGIEVITSGTELTFRDKMAQYCLDYNLFASQGSDFHGPKPWTELGRIAPMPDNVQPVWTQWAI